MKRPISYFTSHVSRFTFHASRFTFHASRFTFYASRFLLLAILLLAACLRFYRLDAQSFWNDEGNSARLAERSVPLILAGAAGDIHPPGYCLLLHCWRALSGESEFALRSLSAACGLTLVALTYLLGRHLFGELTGLTAAFLGAISPFAVYYSQEARMYALLAALAAASTLFAIRILRTTLHVSRFTFHISRILHLASYTLITAAGLYTHYAFSFVLLVHNLLFILRWLVMGRRLSPRWRLVAAWLAAQVAVLILFLPWLPIALRQVSGWPSAGRSYALAPALLEVVRTLTVGLTIGTREATGALIGAGLLLLAGLWPRRELPNRFGQLQTQPQQVEGPGSLPPPLSVAAVVLYLALPIILIFALDLYKPAYLKFLLVVLPPFHVVIAHGVENLVGLARHATRNTEHVLRIVYSVLRVVCYVSVLAAVLPSLHNLYFDPAYARADYRGLAADLEADTRPDDGILLNAPNQWEVFTYYHRDGAPVYPAPYGPGPGEVTAFLSPIAAAHDRLFVVYWGDAESDPDRLVESWLAANAYKAGDRWYGDVRLATYGLAPLPGEPAVPLDARFGDAVTLQGYALPDEPFAPGDIIPLTLFWEAQAPISDRYKVFIHLLNREGRLVAQHDGEPRDGLLPTTLWEPGEVVADRYGVAIPPDAPPGHYTLAAGLYHLVTGDRLRVTLDGEPVGDYVLLQQVRVEAGHSSAGP